MQRRIKLENELKEVHTAYPPLWSNILLSLTEKRPFLPLSHLGSIMLLDGSLYLYLNDKYTRTWVPSLPQKVRSQHFEPQSLQSLNEKDFSELQKSMMQWIVDFFENLILGASRTLFITIVDMKSLGKIIISKNAIEFINQQHNWKYNFVTDRVQLPRLLHTQQSPDYQQTMARKLSLSIQKRRHSRQQSKDVQKSRVVKRSSSVSRINTQSGSKIRAVTQGATSQFYPKRESHHKLRSYGQKLKIQRKPAKTQASQQMKKNNDGYFVLRQKKESQGSFKRSKSKTKYGESSLKIKEDNKQKLKIEGGPKGYMPRDRQRLRGLNNKQQEQQSSIQLLSLVIKHCNFSQEFVKSRTYAQFQQQGYFAELRDIYKQKYQQAQATLEKSRFLKEVRRQEEMKHVKKPSVLPKIQLLSKDEQEEFKKIYSLVQYKKYDLRRLANSYEIEYEVHTLSVQQFIQEASKLIVSSKPSVRLLAKIGLLFHELYQQLTYIEQKLLKTLTSSRVKVVQIKIYQLGSFDLIVSEFLSTFATSFSRLEQCIKQLFPKFVHLQPHQTEAVSTLREKLQKMLSTCRDKYQENLASLSKKKTEVLLEGSFTTERHKIALVEDIGSLRSNIEDECDFKSIISVGSIRLDMAEVKNKFISNVDKKLSEIFNKCIEKYKANENQLSLKLKQTIVININYLNDNHCKDYRKSIESNYNQMAQSLLFILNFMPHFLKTIDIGTRLQRTLAMQLKIQQHFSIFDRKLKDYKDNSNTTVKLIQEKNKSNKKIYQDLNQQLKVLLKQITSQKSLLEHKGDIYKMSSDFQRYNKVNAGLIELMKQNDMIFWEDDPFFETQIGILKKSLQFLQSSHYRVMYSTAIYQLSIESFYLSFEYFKEFMGKVRENKVQKIFQSNYNLVQNSLGLIQIFLYKKYEEGDLASFKELDIELQSERQSKLLALIKKYQGVDRKKLDKMAEIYQSSKLNQYNLLYEFNPRSLQLQLKEGPFGICYISNVDILIELLSSKSEITFCELIDTLSEISALYSLVVAFASMINLISNTNLDDSLKKQIASSIIGSYNKMLSLQTRRSDISVLKKRIDEARPKYLELLYKEKINIFPRYCLYDLNQLISLSLWNTKERIEKNVKLLFQEVDAVLFNQYAQIEALLIGRDTLKLDNALRVQDLDGEKTKAVFLALQNFFRNSLNRSEFASAQIKILSWYIYYTQQVEISFMTQSPLSKLKATLNELILELSNEIRFDIKRHHKVYEIVQLNMFSHHIDQIIAIASINDYEWVSSIRYYDKSKVIKVRQNQKEYDYAFTPKLPTTIDPSFQLIASVSYGFAESAEIYRLSAYLLGQTYKIMKQLSQYGFQRSCKLFVSLIMKYGYFVKVNVHQGNYRHVNYLHKQILQVSLRREKIIELEELHLPIFFQYPSHQNYPCCFPEKVRNFSLPSININLIALLKIDKYHSITDKSYIDLFCFQEMLAYVNYKKNLTIKNIDDFIQSFVQFLKESKNEKQVYKFCFKFFLTNHQLQNQELNAILKRLVRKSEQGTLQDVMNKVKTVFEQFLQGKKINLIIYGPASLKTYSIAALNLERYDGSCSKPSQVYFFEGMSQYLIEKQIFGPFPSRFVIQDRYIWNIDPSELVNNELYYIPELQLSCIEAIFKQNLAKYHIEGNHVILWKILLIFQTTYCQLCEQVSTIAMAELVLKSFQGHIADFKGQLDQPERQLVRITINKQIIRAFTVVCHQIFYFMSKPQKRKQFDQAVINNSLLDQFRSQELSSLTCRGINCEKLINLIKKERNVYLRMISYQKEVLIAQKYLKYNHNIIVDCNNFCSLRLIQKYICENKFRQLKVVPTQKYLKDLKQSKYSGVVFVVDDLDMANKQFLTQLKITQQFYGQYMPFLMGAKGDQYRQVLKQHVSFKISDIEAEDIFKFQTKENILQNIHQKSQLLWNSHYFDCREQYLSFLIQTTIKLPAQFYRKFYARELVNMKFSLQSHCLETIKQCQEYLLQTVDCSSAKAYLFQHQGSIQQISQLQVAKRVQVSLIQSNYLDRIIAKQYYKQILPYCLSERVYIIVEELFLLPKIIGEVRGKQLFRLQCCSFINELIKICSEVYISEAQFIIVIEEPLASDAQWLEFFGLYLRQQNIVKYYNEFKEYLKLLISKEEYIYRKKNQEMQIQSKILQLIFKRMRIIVSILSSNAHLYDIDDCYRAKVIFLNCQLNHEHKEAVTKLTLQKVKGHYQEPIYRVLERHEVLFIELAQHSLIQVNNLEQFFQDCAKAIEHEFFEAKRCQQEFRANNRFWGQLTKIKQDVLVDLAREQACKVKSKQMLDDLMQVISSYNREESEDKKEGQHYFGHLQQIRNKFFCLHDQLNIFISNQFQEDFFKQVKASLFKDQLVITEEYVLLQIQASHLEELILNSQLNRLALQLFQKFNIHQVQHLILFKYFKYILNIVQQYQKIQYDRSLIDKEVNSINYFYLLDLSIELKNKYEFAATCLDQIRQRVKVVESFISVFTSIYGMDINRDLLHQYHIFRHLKKVIRNNSTEQNTYPLMKLLAASQSEFHPIQIYLDQFLLNEEQTNFQSYNRKKLIESELLVSYDPYWKIEELCLNMKAQLIYIEQECDLQWVREYRFARTIYCVRLTDFQAYFQKKQLISKCLDTMRRKNKDLQWNFVEKVVISISDPSVLKKIEHKCTMLNFDYNLYWFHHFLRQHTTEGDAFFKEIKENYVKSKQKLKMEIDLIKNLSGEEISIYLEKIQVLVTCFQEAQSSLRQVRQGVFMDKRQGQAIQTLFLVIKQLEGTREFTLSFLLRCLPKTSIPNLLRKLLSSKIQLAELVEQVRTEIKSIEGASIQQQVLECLNQSRYIAVIYQHFSKQRVKELLQMEEADRYTFRIIIDIDQKQVQQLMYQNSKDQRLPSQIVLFFLKQEQLQKIAPLLNKCAVILL